MDDFIRSKQVGRAVSIHNPFKRPKFKTFASNSVIKKGKCQNNSLANLLCQVIYFTTFNRERSGSVVEPLTRDREAAVSSLTGVTALWSLSKAHLS